MKLKTALSSSIRWIKNNSSLCLSIMSGVGVVATAALSADAAVKTNELVYQKRDQDRIDIFNRYALQDKELDAEDITTVMNITPTENYKLTAKEAVDIWWKPVTVGGITIASIVFNHKLNMKKQATLIAAAGAVGHMYGQYRNAVIKEYGKEADDKIISEVMKSDGYVFNTQDFYFAADANDIVTFYDENIGMFEMTPYNMLKAQYHLNRIIATEGVITLTRWFTILGLEDKIKNRAFCDSHGWVFDQLVSGHYGELPWFDIWYCGRDLDDGTMKAYELDYLIPVIDLEDEETWDFMN